MLVSPKALVNFGLLVLVNAMWAAQYAAYKTVTEQMGPLTAGAWTFLIASLLLSVFLVRERKRGHPVPSANARDSSVQSLWTKLNILGFLMVGVLGLVPASALLAWGVARSTASNAAVIGLTVPIITALLAVAILGERMTGMRWVSLTVSFAGVLILSDFDFRHPELTNSKFLFGNVLVLISAAASAFYNVYSKELLQRFTGLQVLVYSYLIALVVSVPFVLLFEKFSFSDVYGYTLATWIGLLALSVITYGLGMVLWMFVLTRLDVSQASVSIYLLALFGVAISAITLKEKVTTTMIVAGAVTLVGTILATSAETKIEAAKANTAQPEENSCERAAT